MNKDKNPFLKLVAMTIRGILRIYDYICYRPKVIYTNKDVKKYIKKNPVIFVPNHFSYRDGPTCYFLFKNSSLIVARDWYERKWIRLAVYGKPVIPIDRQGLDTAWLRDASDMYKAGKHIFIFPEGHTNSFKEIDEFKAGFVMLSVMTGAPIVPMYIDGSTEVFKGKRLKMYVGDVEELDSEGKGMNAQYLQKECKRFRQMVVDMREKYEKG